MTGLIYLERLSWCCLWCRARLESLGVQHQTIFWWQLLVYDVGHIQFSMQNVLTSAMIKKKQLAGCTKQEQMDANPVKWTIWISYTLPSKSVIFPLPEDPEGRGWHSPHLISTVFNDEIHILKGNKSFPLRIILEPHRKEPTSYVCWFITSCNDLIM